ncbi:MAG: hypothetical protein IKE56_00350 [Lachnospiraceae bacterium]|jgi:hypothetical protein|nr:hypothetical protein [Lachnospiraceae bacterium]
MFVRSIRSYTSDKTVPPHFCDVAIDGSNVFLVRRDPGPDHCRVIAWEDVKDQVERAIRQSRAFS